jgi:crotonobetainyl-CoA:carnitine CoA-transferase CaiB-like acyl-CoA transferase
MRFIAAGIPAGPIWTLDETFKDVHVLKGDCVETFDHPILGTLKQIMNPIRLDAHATAGKRLPPPLLGEHTEVVLREFDISDSDSAMLIDRGIAQQFPKSR